MTSALNRYPHIHQKWFFQYLFAMLLLSLSALNAWAQGNMPPAVVTAAKIVQGEVAPNQEYLGTVFYPEIAKVAAQSSGAVTSVGFEEGERISKGKVMLILDADVLNKTLQATKASFQQVQAELERDRRDYDRYAQLFKDNSVSLQTYEQKRYSLEALEQRSLSIKAEVERLQTELKRKTLYAPFNGRIIQKQVAVGEWVNPGSVVARLARDESMDVVINVREEHLPQLKAGLSVQVQISTSKQTAEFLSIIPQGDIATRTFPVKFRLEDATQLLEGQQARVWIPIADNVSTLMVPRDAVIRKGLRDLVVIIQEGAALSVPVQVTGFKDNRAGIQAESLQAGMQVVTKGHERLRDGQQVRVVN